jgi:cytochrome c biogenesis protein CcdA/thiol-disulfide isomerase/thioredoxin
MIFAVLVFLSGVLTILSPCILPVLPFVFARSEQRFLTSGLPLLAGMSVTFAGIASLAAVGGSWAVRVNQYGRVTALVLLTLFAATLLSRQLADWAARPFVALGNRLLPPSAAGAAQAGLIASLLLGVATGLLWAPCAGPILGLVLTGAAISGANSHTTLLLFAYALGAATSLAVALLAGGRVFAAMKRSLGAGEWVRRALGVAVLLAVVAIAFGWDSTVLTRLSLAGTNSLEQSLIDKIGPSARGHTGTAASNAGVAATDSGAAASNRGTTASGLPDEGRLPSLQGITGWLNSPPLTPAALRGKVVLVDFWTYSCINCLRTLPYVEAWYDKYRDHGLVVIGVHAPEFAFEKNPDNVRRAVHDLRITYPVALDDDYAVWKAFGNQYWPADYFIDSSGTIRGHYFSEGDYDESEQTIRRLLTEAGYENLPPAGVKPAAAAGVEAPADLADERSPETYLGYQRESGFSSPGGVIEGRPAGYTVPPALDLNQWALGGEWTIAPDRAVLSDPHGRIVYGFSARDLHLVLGPAAADQPVRFRVRLDGAAPGASHGEDTDANGEGVVKDQRLYQLIRQHGAVGPHVFSIEFLDGGVQAYAFTFG